MRHVLFAAMLPAALLAGCINVNVQTPSPGGGDRRPSQLPSGSPGAAGDVMGGIFGAEQGLLFYAFDTLAYPAAPVDLSARITTATLEPVRGASVAFVDDRRRPIGTAATDDTGTATVMWTPPHRGNFRFTARIMSLPANVGRDKNPQTMTVAPLLVAARPRDARFVVIDLDHTVVDASFWRVLMGGARPAADSVRVTKRIAGTYDIIYLTQRPDLLTRKSKDWLTQNGYPPGPLLVSTVKAAMSGSGAFKTGVLAEIARSYPHVEIGIGDKLSDAEAYVDNRLIAYLLPHYDKDDTKDMRKLASQLRSLRDRGRIQAVADWRQIEAGIFDARKYTVRAFADSLVRQADRIDRERREEKAHREKDDD